jgi:dTDP-4-dehydrorhamnose 3,5-epimerase-like enzyme
MIEKVTDADNNSFGPWVSLKVNDNRQRMIALKRNYFHRLPNYDRNIYVTCMLYFIMVVSSTLY